MVRLVPQSMREGRASARRSAVARDLGHRDSGGDDRNCTGAMLAVARVLGETAPLLFTAFGSRFYNIYLDEPMASLTVQIFNYAISPFEEWHAKAWAATLVLVTLILFINISCAF
jgi:phosphate transport system permease protein